MNYFIKNTPTGLRPKNYYLRYFRLLYKKNGKIKTAYLEKHQVKPLEKILRAFNCKLSEKETHITVGHIDNYTVTGRVDLLESFLSKYIDLNKGTWFGCLRYLFKY